MNQSSEKLEGKYDLILTDPPYYDAIGYAALMDFFYVWLRRTLYGLSPEFDSAFTEPLSPKIEELIDDASRHGGDKKKSKQAYEDGMAAVFTQCCNALTDNGRFVVVFASKNPDAWETLVAAVIRSGFIVKASWPIATERAGRIRANASASLASSVWLVCKKRSVETKAGWDKMVMDEMRQKIREHLRDYWDSGIRGPDFVWAATGPAMEAFSKYPAVRKLNENGLMTMAEFLSAVRRIVVEYVVGRVLSGEDGDEASLETLDDITAYYLLHRHDFNLNDAPAGACILYALSCGLSDRELASKHNLIGYPKGQQDEENEETDENEADTAEETTETSGNMIRLKTWAQRKSKSLGQNTGNDKSVPLIDRIHCLMHLWRGGDVDKVDVYLDENQLRSAELFKRVMQSIIELSPAGSDERALLESISNHVVGRKMKKTEQLFQNER
ncbi:hypothetical protein FACS1894170_02170 [Planctomycetales bacterium]|nr:hypothetical protein FACS1894170_02170 [Planctomycetales bacterium]